LKTIQLNKYTTRDRTCDGADIPKRDESGLGDQSGGIEQSIGDCRMPGHRSRGTFQRIAIQSGDCAHKALSAMLQEKEMFPMPIFRPLQMSLWLLGFVDACEQEDQQH